MVILEPDFKDKLETAVREQAVSELMGPNGPVLKAIEQSHEKLDASDYNTDSVKDSLVEPIVEEKGNRVTITWGWTHEAADYFERGTSFHRIDGDPVLSFVWEDPPSWVREEFDQARSSGGQFSSGWRVFFSNVHVSGIDEIRYTRFGLEWLRRELQK
ncbi:hypothetical protein SAMN05421858_5119 [Haladaptatus litoreus]|uniref:Uncharacterized protein n=1 Tax=Haladaptatus litoreus TaxID=553468 RepID=A0A1N7FJ10_9EURY|nr:hypothetical protein [Haladaptatus litoreus]SIS00352.1 hypothetical protein SAMN05421858_5119 [Haladaptatus litoreus]